MSQPTPLDLHVAVLTAQLAAHRVQLLAQAGFPVDLTRDPTPIEVASRTSFAGIEDDVNAAAGRLAARALALRSQALDLIAVQLAARSAQGPTAILGYLDGLAASLSTLPGAEQALGQALPGIRAELEALSSRAAGRALADAAASGSPAIPLDEVSVDRTAAALQGRRLAADAVESAVRAARGAAYSTARVSVDGATYVTTLLATARDVGTKGLADVASQAALGANGAGRSSALVVLEEVDPGLAYYASELLDRRTCTPCGGVDGRRYASLAEAEADYPTGRYVGCKGGDRCRGTLITIHETEVAPTLQVPRPAVRPAGARGARPAALLR